MPQRIQQVRIDFACNDPDNGLFEGRAEMIALPGEMAELTAQSVRAPKLVELPGAIRFAGKRWPVIGSVEWIGNWCWNGYWMELPVAVAFILWLRARRLYHLDSGWCSFCDDIWDAPPSNDDAARLTAIILDRPDANAPGDPS